MVLLILVSGSISTLTSQSRGNLLAGEGRSVLKLHVLLGLFLACSFLAL